MRPIAEDAPLDPAGLALLMAWFSPACPVGAYSYSHGLERLEADGGLFTAAECEAAIATALSEGAGRSEAILLAAAYRAERDGAHQRSQQVAALALALAPSAERAAESVNQGNAFAKIVDAAWPGPRPLLQGRPLAYPIAVGRAGAIHRVPLEPLVQAYLQAFATTLISVLVRLVPLGQTDGQRLTARLAPLAAALAQEACAASLDDVGSAALGLDLASMRHECQEVRLFRS